MAERVFGFPLYIHWNIERLLPIMLHALPTIKFDAISQISQVLAA